MSEENQNTPTERHVLINDNGKNDVSMGALDEIDILLGEAETPEYDKDGKPTGKAKEKKQKNADENSKKEDVEKKKPDTEEIAKDNRDFDDDDDEDEDEDEDEDNDDDDIENNDDVDFTQNIEIKMPGGMKSMTLGEMKDEVAKIQISRHDIQEQENSLMVQRQEIGHILQAIGTVPPEVRAVLQQQHQANMVRENQAMLNAVPKWKDEKAFSSDRVSMLSNVHKYGFTEKEFNNVTDHRLIKLVLDYTELKKRVDSADPKKVTAKKKTKPGRTLSRKKQNNASRVYDTLHSKDAAIAKLLEG